MDAPPWLCLSPALSPCLRCRMSLAVPSLPSWPLPLWTERQRPFDRCPCLIPPPHSALMACVYHPVQIRLEGTLHGREIDRKNRCEPDPKTCLFNFLTCLCRVVKILSRLVISGFNEKGLIRVMCVHTKLNILKNKTKQQKNQLISSRSKEVDTTSYNWVSTCK